MPKALLIVYTNPVSPECEDDYNDWYNNVHLPEILGAEGFVAASRYRLADVSVEGMTTPEHRYVAVYELDTEDLQGALDRLMKSAGEFHMSESLDQAGAGGALWEEIKPRIVTVSQ